MRALAIAALLFALSATSTPGAAQELGRLFLTPEQRASLDARRKARVPDKPAATIVASPTTRLDGYVKRSDGRSTVWVDGEALLEGEQGDLPRLDAQGTGRVSIPLGEGRSRARLKPGETIDVGTGAVRDVIGSGRIAVRPPK